MMEVDGTWADLHTGPNDTVVATDVNTTTVELEMKFGYPQYLINHTTEDFKTDADTYTRAYKNANTSWFPIEDPHITEYLVEDEASYRHLDGNPGQVTDENSTDHNFERTIEITDVSRYLKLF